MDGDMTAPAVLLETTVLDRLMPMHLVLDGAGRVMSHGATLGRLFAPRRLAGVEFADLVDIRGVAGRVQVGDLAALCGQKLRLVLRRADAALRLRGMILPLAGPDRAGWIVNLSFGIDLPRAVAQLHLTDADFATTDLAMELLYLAEANAAVTGELRGLALRLEGARQQAQEEAETDPLTGLRNRRACDSVLARLCREGTPFGLMHMDLDYFKAVNDTLGHAAGDHVLTHVAAVIKASSRAQDCIARVGGDEFVMLMPEITDPSALSHIANRVIAQLTRPIPFQEHVCRISASVGYVSVVSGEMPDPAQIMANADIALYAAKHAGRGQALQYDREMATAPVAV